MMSSNGDNLARRFLYEKYFSGVDVIVELGVATGTTSKIFLSCVNKKVIGIDIEDCELDNNIFDYAKSLGVEFEFIKNDDLFVSPIDCDVLFIDTIHDCEHTYKELKHFSPNVKKYIALHDVNPALFDTMMGVNKWLLEGADSEWEECYKDYCICGLLILKRKTYNGTN